MHQLELKTTAESDKAQSQAEIKTWRTSIDFFSIFHVIFQTWVNLNYVNTPWESEVQMVISPVCMHLV